MSDQRSLILVGACLGAFGVRGEMRVKSFTARPESVGDYGPLYAQDGRKLLTPVRVRPLKGDEFALTAAEITDRDTAETLKGASLFIPRAVLPKATDDDEFYIADLIGAAVRHVDGRDLGAVRTVLNFGAGDLLEIETNGRRWLLPFTRENVPALEAGLVRVDPSEGLLPDDMAGQPA